MEYPWATLKPFSKTIQFWGPFKEQLLQEWKTRLYAFRYFQGHLGESFILLYKVFFGGTIFSILSVVKFIKLGSKSIINTLHTKFS